MGFQPMTNCAEHNNDQFLDFLTFVDSKTANEIRARIGLMEKEFDYENGEHPTDFDRGWNAAIKAAIAMLEPNGKA